MPVDGTAASGRGGEDPGLRVSGGGATYLHPGTLSAACRAPPNPPKPTGDILSQFTQSVSYSGRGFRAWKPTAVRTSHDAPVPPGGPDTPSQASLQTEFHTLLLI